MPRRTGFPARAQWRPRGRLFRALDDVEVLSTRESMTGTTSPHASPVGEARGTTLPDNISARSRRASEHAARKSRYAAFTAFRGRGELPPGQERTRVYGACPIEPEGRFWAFSLSLG